MGEGGESAGGRAEQRGGRDIRRRKDGEKKEGGLERGGETKKKGKKKQGRKRQREGWREGRDDKERKQRE